jgi:hypothetical protein
MKIIQIFLSAILLFSCCRPPVRECRKSDTHTRYAVKNNSNRKIIFQEWYFKPIHVPDTNAIGISSPLSSNISSYTKGLLPGESYFFSSERDYCIESEYSFDKKNVLTIYDYDSLLLLPWDTIRFTKKGELETRIIDLDYLIKHKFEVTYP